LSATGLGITVAVAVCFALWLKTSRKHPTQKPQIERWQRQAWCGCLFLFGAIIISKLGTGPVVPRNLLPWMPIALAPLLGLIGRETVARSQLWKITALLAMFSVLPALLFTPSRHVLPSSFILGLGEKIHLSDVTRRRIERSYAVYERRIDPF